MSCITFEKPRFRPPRFNLVREQHNPLTETEFLQNSVLFYIWLHDSEHFWFYPTRIDRRLVSGFREMYSQWVFASFYTYEIEGFY